MSAIEERRLAASLRLLVAASRELSTSFDYAQTLAAVGRLIVPDFADGFSVEVDEGEIRTILVLRGDVDSSALEIPLVARGRSLGVMRVMGPVPENLAASELDLWGELGLRIANSIDAALYTDGLIEYSRDVLAGELALLEAVQEGVSTRSDAPARALVERVFALCSNTDDVATLVVTSADVPSRTFGFTFSALPMAVPIVRRSMQRFAERIGLDEDRRFALLAACGEAIANAVEHAYAGAPGLVRVTAHANHDTLVISVEDEGKWKPAQRRDERGRGLPLMRALMDAVEIRTHQARTEVRLTMSLPSR